MENSICITGIKRRPGDRGGRSDTDPGRTDRTCDHLQITAYQSGADNIRKDYQRKFRNLSVVSTGKKEMTTGYVRGEVTVYLTLTFILLVSLVLALTESASIQMAKNYRRADMNRAVECVFAEYQLQRKIPAALRRGFFCAGGHSFAHRSEKACSRSRDII